MFLVEIPSMEYYDENANRFVNIEAASFRIEHSLVSLSKWESKWNKPFLDDRREKTSEELIDYIRCMTLDENVSPLVYTCLSNDILNRINQYIEAPMTATWFSDDKVAKKGRSREVITAEIIYYWMVALNIPFECQYWHINRLLTLIRVCSIKNAPPKKMGKKEVLRNNAKLNAARKRSMNTKG